MGAPFREEGTRQGSQVMPPRPPACGVVRQVQAGRGALHSVAVLSRVPSAGRVAPEQAVWSRGGQVPVEGPVAGAVRQVSEPRPLLGREPDEGEDPYPALASCQ